MPKQEPDLSTDYSDPNIMRVAEKVYEVETSVSQHYENMRTQLLQFTLLLTGGLVTVGKVAGLSPQMTGLLLIVSGYATGFAAYSISNVHTFHWVVAAKMRRVFLLSHKKPFEKFDEIAKRDRVLNLVEFDTVWNWMIFLVPTVLGFYLIAFRQDWPPGLGMPL